LRTWIINVIVAQSHIAGSSLDALEMRNCRDDLFSAVSEITKPEITKKISTPTHPLLKYSPNAGKLAAPLYAKPVGWPGADHPQKVR
jgi:hypothetical protein